MAVFSVAPSVKWTERDATLFTKAQLDIAAGHPGFSTWGPVGKAVNLTLGEEEKVKRFGAPDDNTYLDHFVMADYMQYSKAYWFYRIVGPLARNAVPTGQTAIRIDNKDVFEGYSVPATIPVLGRYPGSLGNNLVVFVADASTFEDFEYKNLFEYTPVGDEICVCVVDKTGVISGLAGQTNQRESFTLSGVVTEAGNVSVAGKDVAVLVDDTAEVVANKIVTAFVDDVNYVVTAVKGNVTIKHIAFGKQTPIADVVSVAGLTVDNQQVVEYGSSGQVIPGEKWELLSTNPEAKRSDGSNAYFYEVINSSSKYIYAGQPDALAAGSYPLQGGVDDYTANRIDGYKKLGNAEAYDLDSMIGVGSVPEQQACIDSCLTRRDAIAFISPPMEAVVNNDGNEIDDIGTWVRTLGRDNSYYFMDDNWGLVWDKYANKVRWIPCCGGTSGLYARTKAMIGPWKSPAFHNRGKYKGYRRLAWSAESEQRTPLYKLSVNSIVTFPKEGPILYGDKTGLSRPSAFSRINVRGTFIMMAKNISTSAKYFLGENNDTFTRSLFSNTVRPYLRNLEDMGAIIEGKVKCDETNNTGQVIAENQMVAGIYVKPQQSINWILLDFAAVRADMSFEEVEGPSGIVSAD